MLQVVALVLAVLSGFLGPAWDGPARLMTTAIGVVLLGAGLVLAGGAIRSLGPALTPLPKPRTDAALVQSGAYALVRHPIYGGGIVVVVAWGLLTASVATLVVAAAILVFLDVKSRREEAWLTERFPDYPAYRARTRRLLPWVY